MSVNLTAGDYYVVVDGNGTAMGDYTLNVSCYATAAPTPPASTNTASGRDNDLDDGGVAGVVIAVLILVALIAVAVFVLVRRSRDAISANGSTTVNSVESGARPAGVDNPAYDSGNNERRESVDAPLGAGADVEDGVVDENSPVKMVPTHGELDI